MAKIETIPPYAKAIMWVAGIFMPLFLILPFFFYGGTDITGHTLDKTELQAGNLAPFGKLTLSSDIPVEAVAAVLDVQATYDKVCAACHATGISGAPVQGNQAAWQAKIDERGSVEALAHQRYAGKRRRGNQRRRLQKNGLLHAHQSRYRHRQPACRGSTINSSHVPQGAFFIA